MINPFTRARSLSSSKSCVPKSCANTPPPVNIADNEHRSVQKLRQSHIYNVVFLKIDLRRAARPLDHNDIRLLL